MSHIAQLVTIDIHCRSNYKMTVKQLQSNIGGRSFTSFPTPKLSLNKAKLFKFPVAHVVGFASSTAILALPLLSLRRMTSANGCRLVGPQCHIPLSTHRVQPSLRSEEILVWVQGKPPREQAGPLNQHQAHQLSSAGTKGLTLHKICL